MLFSYNWLKDYVKGLPPANELAELLSNHFTEVEEVRDLESGAVLDIDVRPNRASDCFSHWGIARECSVILNKKLQLPKIAVKEKGAPAEDFVKVEVREKEACPRYTARVIENAQVGPSPSWLKKRLNQCGIQSINNIVDIANYVMLETGQPLHAFDLGKLKGSRIIVRFAKKGEKLITLDEQKFDLDKDILVIADEKDPVAIAGIKGGKGPGIDKDTKVVVLESANFERRTIRKASQKLGIRTDASWRFEHGIDPNLTEEAIDRATVLIREIAGGRISPGCVDNYPEKKSPLVLLFDLERAEKLLGIKVPKKEALRIFNGLGFKIIESTDERFKLEIPTRRMDITLPEDLAEELGRIYDYDKIPACLPHAILIPPRRNFEIFWEEFSKDVLKEAGMTEVYNYSFINDKQVEIFRIDKTGLLEITNPLSEEYKYLSPTLVPNLLKNVQLNLKYFSDVEIFELGKVFQKHKDRERRRLAGLIARKENEQDEFYELKGIVEGLFEKAGINNAWYDEVDATPEHSSMSIWDLDGAAEIKVGDEEIGFLGHVSSKILNILKIEAGVIVFDLDFDRLQKLASERREYEIISPYPIATRDLAVLVPREVRVADVLNVINRVGGKLVRDVDLFDFYEGENIPEGKKNLAFHVAYQAEDRTLKAEDLGVLHGKITRALEEKGWEVRR